MNTHRNKGQRKTVNNRMKKYRNKKKAKAKTGITEERDSYKTEGDLE